MELKEFKPTNWKYYLFCLVTLLLGTTLAVYNWFHPDTLDNPYLIIPLIYIAVFVVYTAVWRSVEDREKYVDSKLAKVMRSRMKGYRRIGIIYVLFGVGFGILALEYSVLYIAIGLLLLAILVRLLHTWMRIVFNMSPTMIAFGILYLVAYEMNIGWITGMTVSAVVVATGLLYIIAAPWLVRKKK